MMDIKRRLAYANKDQAIIDQVKKRREIIYGSQSLRIQEGILSRQPGDWDILSHNPRKSADSLQSTLDRQAGGDHYFVKRAGHRGPYKVREKGEDDRRNTEDDLEVADYTKIGKRKITVLDSPFGKVLSAQDIVKMKERAAANPKYRFRREKDTEDVLRYRFNQRLRGEDEGGEEWDEY
jgi:hypothetical protein